MMAQGQGEKSSSTERWNEQEMGKGLRQNKKETLWQLKNKGKSAQR